jgi:hypothetical protein
MSPITLVGEKLAQQSIASKVLTANVTTVATSSGTATALMTLGPAGYEGGLYRVLLSCSAITKGTTNVSVELWVDGAFNQAVISLSTNANAFGGFFWMGLVALNPGAHTVEFRGFVDAGTGTLVAGTGATGTNPNAVGAVIPA